jgi:hypothetical protein
LERQQEEAAVRIVHDALDVQTRLLLLQVAEHLNGHIFLELPPAPADPLDTAAHLEWYGRVKYLCGHNDATRALIKVLRGETT